MSSERQYESVAQGGGRDLFTKLVLKNFRTHTDSSLTLGPVTLLLGANNTGKSNFFAGLRHFSILIARSRDQGRSGPSPSGTLAHSSNEEPIEPPEDGDPESERTPSGTIEEPPDKAVPHLNSPYVLQAADYFPHRHRLASPDLPMAFSCFWTHEQGTAFYQIELYETDDTESRVACREFLHIAAQDSDPRDIKMGFDAVNGALMMRRSIPSFHLTAIESGLVNELFRDLASVYTYNFQPSFLKGRVPTGVKWSNPNRLRIPASLGYEGGNLQVILRLIQKLEERTFNRFLASLQRFDKYFRTISSANRGGSRDQTLWLFDLGRVPARFDEFTSEVVSEGLLRAAAIALVTSLASPPALILLEEIENGISQRNLGRFLNWLEQACGTSTSDARGFHTQFMVTSHSPSVLREFSSRLNNVFHFRLERRGFRTVVGNLNSSLRVLVDMGTIDADEVLEQDGSKVVIVSPLKLTELWYSGVIGGETEQE